MNLHEVTKHMMTAHQATKRGRCTQEGGPTDLSPMVDVRLGTGEAMIALVPDRDFIEAAVLTLAGDRRVRFIGFCADAYGKEYLDGEAPEGEPVQGEVGAAFRAGDLTVVELLTITVIDVISEEVVMLESRYHYDDRGRPRFGEVRGSLEPGADLQGQVVDNLRAVAAECRGAW
jgi:hypothetical protein